MAFGKAKLVEDPVEKERALVMMVDRLFPGRTAILRKGTQQEIKATAVIAMEIERASAKVRAKGVVDDDEDYTLPIYAERVWVATAHEEPLSGSHSTPARSSPRNSPAHPIAPTPPSPHPWNSALAARPHGV